MNKLNTESSKEPAPLINALNQHFDEIRWRKSANDRMNGKS